jgi:non-ribosomal peptide synthetase component E (peptide arylation enzyme)
LSTALGDFAKPKQLLIFDEMPMIGIGKIDRMQICERAQEELNG